MNFPLRGRTIGLLTAYASRNNGGVFEAVVAQADLIRTLGGQAMIFALVDAATEQDRPRFGASPVVACRPSGPPQIGYSAELIPALLAAPLDCLHLHGIWMYPSRAGSVWAARTGKAYLVSPHGMLDPWITARGRLKKAVARLAYEKAGWRRATALHALTPREAGDIARESGRTDSLIIPNAGPLALPAAAGGDLRAPTVLYIGRIHPKKNLLPLVEAWHRLAAAQAHPANARLTICGWGADADIAALRTAIAAGPGAIEFAGPTFGQDKERLLAQARYMILPSLSEGLPMAILEAWAAGMPTIMTSECNLDEGFAAGAALPCGFDATAIAQALTQAWQTTDSAWRDMQAAALGLADSRFSPPAIAAHWAQAYHTAITQGARR